MPHVLALGLDPPARRQAGRGAFRPTFRRPRRSLIRRLKRMAFMALGTVLILLGALIAPLPGPFGLPVAVVGLVIVLRNSYWAKRRFIRAQRAWPRYVYPFRRLMRKKPEFAPVFWQQALRMERFALGRGQRVLIRWRRVFRRRTARA